MAKYNAAQLKAFSKMGIAMPGERYPVKDLDDLESAITAVGETVNASGEAAAEAVRRHIMTRAKALHLDNKIPDTWNPDGSLKHGDFVDEFLSHHGVLGMKWGHRKGGSSGVNRVKVPVGSSEDHQRAAVIRDKARKNGGIHSLSNDELKSLNDRLNLEQSYKRLVEGGGSEIAKGRKFVKNVVSDVKTGVDVYNTGKQVKTIVDELTKK